MKIGHVKPDTLEADYPRILGSSKLIINVFFLLLSLRGVPH